MDWSIQDIARLAGTTSRTLRHYGEVGILPPSRIGSNGYRYYDERALARLQRILMLRELGLGIPAIADVLEGQRDHAQALVTHLQWLRQEQQRLDRQIASVETTIRKMEGGEQLMAEEMFDGFDHTVYREEVEQRWGEQAYADGNRWWTSLGTDEQRAWQARAAGLIVDWKDAAARGLASDSDDAQALAHRQFEWLSGIPGTPQSADGTPTKEYFVGLGDMYVADERLAATYGGVESATFVRDAMRVYAERELG
ncbi:MerR family transcriptional regulator [Leifsonia sp. H3M29-4]|uniref:MerR family transcriptional regulator n=1 Tax=Salinibacterium metalliresistens TaxID=3031321 RepID=UPI0023DBE71E|nr:MerR family transcriptional regulator [Salinibacterium metalliresistens]MDF1477555.1 MerR family transcriptional regulator [Salinibacterium metalliresistens]